MSASVAPILLLTALLLSACSPDLSFIQTRSPVDRPPFEPHECWMSIPSNVEAACGFVVVPENRSKPLDEDNTVRLAVVILRAPGVEYTQPPTEYVLGFNRVGGYRVVGRYPFESFLGWRKGAVLALRSDDRRARDP